MCRLIFYPVTHKLLVDMVLEVPEIRAAAVCKGIVAEQRDPCSFPEARTKGAGPGKPYKVFIVNTERKQRCSGKLI